MRLHSTITSPYARKVWVFAHETGLIKDIQRIPTNPHVDEYLRDENPLCRVPTLVMDAGEALFDSPVICEYLDSLHSGRRLIPAEGPAQWGALRLQAIGDGMLDANVSRRMEMIRPPNEQSPSWIARQTQALEAACSWLESRVKELRGRLRSATLPWDARWAILIFAIPMIRGGSVIRVLAAGMTSLRRGHRCKRRATIY
jgi:glutathione S-transferase